MICERRPGNAPCSGRAVAHYVDLGCNPFLVCAECAAVLTPGRPGWTLTYLKEPVLLSGIKDEVCE